MEIGYTVWIHWADGWDWLNERFFKTMEEAEAAARRFPRAVVSLRKTQKDEDGFFTDIETIYEGDEICYLKGF